MQNICSFEYSVRLEELGGFFRDQRWMHMHNVLRSRGITLGIESAVALFEEEGLTRKEALREIGLRRREGALASLEAQGFTGEAGARSASTELGRRGGEASSAIYRTSGNCSYPGCTLAVNSSEFCKNHRPATKKPEKSDMCRNCGRVFRVKEKVVGGVCNPCYCKSEAVAALKKATAEKKKARGTCSTPGCKSFIIRGGDKCGPCMFPSMYKPPR